MVIPSVELTALFCNYYMFSYLSPRLYHVFSDDFAHIPIPPTFDDISNKVSADLWLNSSHFPESIRSGSTKIRCQHTWRYCNDLNTIFL